MTQPKYTRQQLLAHIDSAKLDYKKSWSGIDFIRWKDAEKALIEFDKIQAEKAKQSLFK